MEFSRSHSQKLGMKFFIPVPVPKVWEWAEPFPFPFPNHQKSFPLTPDPDLFSEGWIVQIKYDDGDDDDDDDDDDGWLMLI